MIIIKILALLAFLASGAWTLHEAQRAKGDWLIVAVAAFLIAALACGELWT